MEKSKCTQCRKHVLYCKPMLFTSPREENVCPSCIKEFVKKFEPKWKPFFGAQNKETGKRSIFDTKEELEGVLLLGEPEISNHDYFLIEREKWDERLMNAWLNEEQDDSISWKTIDIEAISKILFVKMSEIVVGWRKNNNRLIMSFPTLEYCHGKDPESLVDLLVGDHANIVHKDDISKAIHHYVRKNPHLVGVPFKTARLRHKIDMYELENFCFPNSDPKIHKMEDLSSALHYWHDPAVYARNLFIWKDDDESYTEWRMKKLVRKRQLIDWEIESLEKASKRPKESDSMLIS